MIGKPVVLLAAILAVMLFASPSFAGITGSAHALPGGTGCDTCHLAHNALGERLWPADMSTTGDQATFGIVGSLCFYCHGTSGGAGLGNAVQTYVLDATLGQFSHGLDFNDLPTGDNLDSTLPYGTQSAGGKIECTTCHNVHDDTNLPFLQDDIDVLCARCHEDRMFVGGSASATQGSWGANYGSSNPGSHPVGEDVADDTDGDDSPITIASAFQVAYGATNGNHILGGHLTDGGTDAASGVTCVTCHAVHGSRPDNEPPTSDGSDGTPPVNNLLVIAQSATGSIANGAGDDANKLCEGCHDSPAGTIDAYTGILYVVGEQPNPGATNYSHPADDMGASTEAGVTAFPAGWPVASVTAGNNVAPDPLCESCHTPHPLANVARASITVGSGTPILRDTEAAICDRCHTFPTGGGHHPSNVAMGRMDGDDIGNGDSTLTCSDCHGGGAHNWGSEGLGFDPQWTPTNNGRAASLSAEEALSAGMSAECEKCHYDLSGTPHLSPTNNATDGGAVVDGEYQDIGEGTHYLGDATGGAAWYTGGSINSATFNAETTAWSATYGGADGWSRFDGATGHVVCESCHELEPDKNVAGTKLLLQRYVEGGTTTGATGDDPSGLCEGCHGETPGGGTPHPMTGANVGVTVGDPTGHTLSTTSSSVRSTIIGNATFPAVNGMNCDGCHQPHDADTQSGTYILDSDSTVADVTGTAPTAEAGHTPANRRGADAVSLNYSAFCGACHDYY